MSPPTVGATGPMDASPRRPLLSLLLLLLLASRVRPHGDDEGPQVSFFVDSWQQHDAAPQGLTGVLTFGLEDSVASSSRGLGHGHHGRGEEDDHHGHDPSSSGLRGGSIPHILIVYASQTGHTEQLAHVVLNGALDLIPSCHIEAVPLARANHSVLTEWADVLVLGSPVIDGQPASALVNYLRTVPELAREQLGKLRGASFVTAGGIGGGQELVIDALNREMASVGIQPLTFPDCRYSFGLAAITGFPPFCRQGAAQAGCSIEQSEIPGRIHPQFEAFGYEFGRQLVNLMTDPNAPGNPY